MTTEDLWNTLRDLKEDEFKEFKWLLQQDGSLEGFPAIKVSKLEKAERTDAVDVMVKTYGLHGALKVTSKVLEKIGRNDLVLRLQEGPEKRLRKWMDGPEPQPLSPTFREPWTEIRLKNKDSDLGYVNSYQPETDKVQHLRILLHGPVGAGKSSFISSVSSVLLGRMAVPALFCADNMGKSFTTKYKTHRIQKGGRGSKVYYPFVFNDIMGMEEGEGRGVSAKDIKLAMKGHMTEGYKFNPVRPLSKDDKYYNSSPSADDKAHVLVCIFSANTPAMTGSVLKKTKEVRETASDLGIPQIAVLTHIDDACDVTNRDIKNVYNSKILKQKMSDFSSVVGIPMNCIFPVKNYTSEINLDDDMDVLILSALRKIIDFGEDFLNKV